MLLQRFSPRSTSVLLRSSGPALSRALEVLSRSQSTCALSSSRQPQRKVLSSVRQRRPLVNGEAIAFHVNDLVNNDTWKYDSFPTIDAKKQKQYDSDLIVVLDMDECLIHSKFLSPGSQHFAHQLIPRRHHANGNRPVDTFRVSLPDGDQVHVNVRPGLYEFLQNVTDKFETHVFTAAMQVYAQPVLDRIDPHNKLAGRWYREHCVFSPEKGAYVKSLAGIFDNLHRVVLVDNNPLSFIANPENGILVSSFYNDADDSTLPAVWDLLQELDAHRDVRPVLEHRFGIKDALQQMKA